MASEQHLSVARRCLTEALDSYAADKSCWTERPAKRFSVALMIDSVCKLPGDQTNGIMAGPRLPKSISWPASPLRPVGPTNGGKNISFCAVCFAGFRGRG